ncbi:MAG: hypothetical protein A2Y62_15715 [Candidatus Fischerbacteria bacterium RBG_13_37_8]|uniref:CHAT domain-containing protein n=1 Tax=Candidatus Fischerbacteria bacterium RBG_13_37_8 TaxID=1817863 RepID=A0A1F5VVP1_9BACT|nr:MAG: hypothetical protein A2Y62_15715 [Candidatus Fischerbacteria bacterium RBG_13_37_8]
MKLQHVLLTILFTVIPQAILFSAGENVQVLYNQALAQSYGNECDKAVETAQDIISENSSNADYYEILYNCFGKAKIDIEGYLFALAQRDVNNALPYYALGKYYVTEKNYDEAIRVLKKAYELDRKYLNIPYYIAYAYLKAEKVTEGYAYFAQLDDKIWSKAIGVTLLKVMHENNIESIKELEQLFKEHADSWQLADKIRHFYFQLNENEQAIVWSYAALKIAQENHDDRNIADSLSAVAAHSINTGDIIVAREYSARAADKWEETGDKMQAAEWYKNTAMCVLDDGRINEALGLYKKALDISRENNFDMKLCLINNSIGFTYIAQLGEYEKAMPYFQDAMEYCEIMKKKYLTLSGMSSVYLNTGKLKESKVALDEARELLGDKTSTFEESTLLSHECSYYAAIEDWRTAEEKCNKLLDLPVKSLLTQMINNYINAKLYYRIGKYERTIEYVTKSKDMADLIEQFPYQWRTRLLLADSFQKTGKIDDAISLYRQAMQFIEKGRQEAGTAQFRMLFSQNVNDVYDHYLKALLKKYQMTDSKDDRSATSLLEEAFAVAEKAKGRTLLDMLFKEKELYAIEDTPEMKKVISKITTLQSRIRSIAGAAAESSKLAGLKEELHRAYDEYQLLKEIAEGTPNGVNAFAANISLSDIQKSIPEHAALLEFKMMQDEGSCFIINKDKVAWVNIPDIKDLERAIDAMTMQIASPSRASKGPLHVASFDLFRLLMRPVLEKACAAKLLIIVPDGMLNNIPFEAITVRPPISHEIPGYLVQRHAIVYAPSAYIYHALVQRSKTAISSEKDGVGKNLLAVADPAYEGTFLEQVRSTYELNQPLGRLQFSRKEVESIGKMAAFSTEQMIGEKATEADLKEALHKKYAYLHFAVHGIVNVREPGLSGLILTPGSKNEDGVFQLFEIEKLSIASQLVFLSACNSATGRIYSGEGMIGLSTAFIRAGAQRVIGTMWTIDDYSTSELVYEFYKSIANANADYAEALRNAQLSIMKQPRYSHPYYWASFRLIGIN